MKKHESSHIQSDAEVEQEIQKLVSTVSGLTKGGALKHYIGYIQFPLFKALEPGTRITFDFPLTALVGPNGVGKSSVLHALWGAPLGYSTSKFWFATALDPIQGSPRYFYSYWHEQFKDFVETRKQRIGQKRGDDYWEPARLSNPDGMKPLPEGTYPGKSKDRWNPVERKVEYINFKTTFGSFDRFFHMEEGFTKQDRRVAMMTEAKRLKSIIENNKKEYVLGNRQRLFQNRDLTSIELAEVSKIIGHQYLSARYVEHSLYPGHRGKDISVYFERGNQYSEAYAGSGEVAAIHAVVKILGAAEYSLVLLDEPETSLHPGAQRAFLRFLLEQIKLKKLQVVISTHSMEYLTGLPHAAIKVLEPNDTGKTRVLPSSSPNAALVRLGKTPQSTTRLLVEDAMAKALVMRAMEGLDTGDAKSLEVKIAPGGADAILKHLAPAYMVSSDDVYVLLDGDQRKVAQFSDPADISESRRDELPQIVKSEVGLEPMFHIQGGNGVAAHRAAKLDACADFLSWLRSRLSYLPQKVPEITFLTALEPSAGHEHKSAEDAKKDLRKLLSAGVSLTSEQWLGVVKVTTPKIPNDHPDIIVIREQLRAWLSP